MAIDEEKKISFPKAPIDRLIHPIEQFLHVEAASGVVLLACTVVALALANSPLADGYASIWKTKLGFSIGSFEMYHYLQHWINDGLMAIFFFVIGLEVKREIVLGELGDFRRAALPMAAALGGMAVPAAIYIALQYGKPGESGWGIPMATDIAFVVGCMALLGRRVPHGFRILILSLAIADDIGAILVIAIGYTESLNLPALGFGFGGLILAAVIWSVGIRNLLVHAVVGVLVWFAFHESGVHATVAGVALGMLTPVRPLVTEGFFADVLQRASAVFHGESWQTQTHRVQKVRFMQRATRETVPPGEYLEGTLHPWVSFVIMPIFALANAGVPFQASSVTDPIAIAVILGLLVGKTVGVFGSSWLAVKCGLAQLPAGINWSAMFGGAILTGIGFTMSLFIAGLALEGDQLNVAKVGILIASAIAAVVGMIVLKLTLNMKRSFL